MTAASHHPPVPPLEPSGTSGASEMPDGRVRPEGVLIEGVAFDRLSEAQAVGHLIQALGAGRGGWVITSNLDHLNRARRDPEFREMLDEADLVVADGAPLIWASRLQGTPLPERVAGSAMAWSLTEAAAAAGRSVFLLGGDLGTAEKAAQALKEKFPRLTIAGTFYPPMGFEKDPDTMEAMRAALRAARPDLVYVALGSPKQERLIRQLQAELPQAWWLGLGISLSFICGEVQRAPVWMQKAGLEWFHRMVQEPRRLVRRYLLEGVPFGLRLVTCSTLKRFAGDKEALIRKPQTAEIPRGEGDPLAANGGKPGGEDESVEEDGKDRNGSWGV